MIHGCRTTFHAYPDIYGMLPPETKSQRSFWPENTKKNFFDQKRLEMSLKLIPAKLGFIKTFSFIVINLTIK